MGMLTLSFKRPDMQPEELNEHELIGKSAESDCDKEDEDIPGEVSLARSKELLEIVHEIESTKSKIIES